MPIDGCRYRPDLQVYFHKCYVLAVYQSLHLTYFDSDDYFQWPAMFSSNAELGLNYQVDYVRATNLRGLTHFRQSGKTPLH